MSNLLRAEDEISLHSIFLGGRWLPRGFKTPSPLGVETRYLTVATAVYQADTGLAERNLWDWSYLLIRWCGCSIISEDF